jgi:tetratricopeptide (TPR) repeat protein
VRRRSTKPATKPSALRRLGLATPPPFFGRVREFAILERHLGEAPLVVVTGAVGSGKTRLARELATRQEFVGDLRATYVHCEVGDLASAVTARAERALDVLPGSLAGVLQHERRLLLIDDLHHLPAHDAARVLGALVARNAVGRVIAFTRDSLPLHRNDPNRRDIALEGLDEGAARDLWSHLENLYGPTPAGASDDAIARTRGMPLALRREYAGAVHGDGAWDLDRLEAGERAALEAAAVLRLPAAPAAIGAMLPTIDAEKALANLVSLQLLDPADDGRFAMHDIVREEVMNALESARRTALELAAAELTADGNPRRGKQPRGISWEVRDGAALGLADPVDRLRESVRHLVAAGELGVAVDRLVGTEELAARRGCGGEVLALIDGLAAEAPERRERLERVRAAVAYRHGDVATALEIWDRLSRPEGVAGATQDVVVARLSYRSGDVAKAEHLLAALAEQGDAQVRGGASGTLVELRIAQGRAEEARDIAITALDRDRSTLSARARTVLGVRLAAAEEALGRTTAARAALSRAASAAGGDPGLRALVAARLAGCLALEGRLSDAENALVEAETAALEVDEVAVAEEIRRRRAVVLARRGRQAIACDSLREIVDARRARGDEIGAMRAEIDLAQVLERRGLVAAAAELAAACAASAARRGLKAFAAEARLVGASVDASELRLDEACEQLRGILSDSAAPAAVRARAAAMLQIATAWASGAAPADESLPYCDDEIDHARVRASIALAAGDVVQALDSARSAAVWAERAGRMADMADALSLAARMYVARGDKQSANAAATRAVREGRSCGLTRAQARGLLVLSALRRDAGDAQAALTYARDALALATDAGLAFERLVAAEAIDVIDTAPGDENREARDAAAATMSRYAISWTSQALSDLGLTAARPFRVVNASGQESFVADANPGILRMEDRALAVDGVREVIVRHGKQIADLRRRSLLKRLLFLLAASPARTFSKEEIVQTVWEVEYHPLRHDAALFTNIMRIRRLLGEDGADIIRVSEDGYRFCAPPDFVFVENVAD